jgi:hypothetical protein
MLDSQSTLSLDTGKSGRATERSSVARPRYQQGSLKAIGKTSWKIRWREDVTNQDGTIRGIYHAETLRQKNKAEALGFLEAVKMRSQLFSGLASTNTEIGSGVICFEELVAASLEWAATCSLVPIRQIRSIAVPRQ